MTFTKEQQEILSKYDPEDIKTVLEATMHPEKVMSKAEVKEMVYDEMIKHGHPIEEALDAANLVVSSPLLSSPAAIHTFVKTFKKGLS